jgi:hypothetical protein
VRLSRALKRLITAMFDGRSVSRIVAELASCPRRKEG